MNQERIQQVQQARKHRFFKRVFVWVVVAAVVIGGAYVFLRYLSHRNETLPGVVYADQGQDHVTLEEPRGPYNSNPPTSGPHLAGPAPWGVYRDSLPDRQLIHNLEHGGVWISYKPGISEELIKKLEGFSKKYGSKVIVAPREQNDSDIALAVWTRLEKFSVAEYSDARVDTFIRRLRNKTGPEPLAM
ncbi:MAG: hypothetical protein A3I44_04225 [Candidatus Sungbacteria bacterium RIFCSPLOWO2_02_FULL_51_17]|uniref:DUF3105 domain-containing protein n=1 Tax=Candidatus Sungbacteria bacterium RIFCSPHIGHO2_02_FULL_51_29 TaxID=1802273 RepID=A0A1G2KW75_9BACT|nr:MAG: hypothetical protein A2676_02735 [Candidatus Sungbacteria bacterium RIFCSPHIGHO2_01_FULL_51_22]OHA03695.1 MAG: hypothetical protein A3C16_03605 [Candidatus Sungbacteria bacterium RIFCSPHIGHO2_02_FULL_51_29]OHA07321.1 MAG: hypothetical protein A3B29_02830 [Candidatus Sungbacteria bacterium RIFCSPLOWO2_01_FULL_51_34]OHA11284.1 MAG: hypothetical protein A3I44_04225 [Candidatus Sungbacteria bacterium RIFCSPLOWO2_02_FULL_51_17]